MERFFPVLRSSPLFSGIEENDLGAMLACLGAKARSFAKGETILSESQLDARLSAFFAGFSGCKGTGKCPAGSGNRRSWSS